MLTKEQARRYGLKMTNYEKAAFDCGVTFMPETEEKNAPCYDLRMQNLVCEARSEAGRKYNERNIRAWWAGRIAAGSKAPAWIFED